jgi:molybdenum cofactor biosynthesis protein A
MDKKVLTDNFSRFHDYLRISLTDSCNFRCFYCMPDGPLNCLPAKDLMSVDEIVHMAETFVRLGVKKIRLTGGEPMVRKEFAEILERLSALPVELTMTTNGILVDKYLPLLKKCGIRSLNVSLDSLDRETFFKITKRDQFNRVWNNIELLLREDFRVKINAVAMSNLIEKELVDFIEITRQVPLHVRFIEFMPFDGNKWSSNRVITASEMLRFVKSEYDVVKLRDEPHATAKKYKVIGFEGTFAFITTMSEHFCGSCNRLRLTADGKLKNCLFGQDEWDLLTSLRDNQSVLPLIERAVLAKHAKLGGQLHEDFEKNEAGEIKNRSMINIGG